MLIALDRRPFARSLAKWYGPAVVVGYCAIIALATSQQWPWLEWWLGLWTPVVDVLRQIIPLFDNFERALVAKGFGHRVAVIHHLLAFGWTVGIAIFVFLFLTVMNLSREEWKRFVSIVPTYRLALVFIGGTIAFLPVLYWIVFGFGLTSDGIPLFAWHRYDPALIGIGINFYGVTLFGIGTQISLGGLLVGWRMDAMH